MSEVVILPTARFSDGSSKVPRESGTLLDAVAVRCGSLIPDFLVTVVVAGADGAGSRTLCGKHVRDIARSAT